MGPRPWDLGACSARAAARAGVVGLLVASAAACEPPPPKTARPAAGPVADAMPWPLPSPSTSMEIPADARAPVVPGARLAAAAEWLKRGLAQAGYPVVAFYDVPGGFVVRTPMELIDDQGQGMTPPDANLRFAAQPSHTRFFTTPFWADLLAGRTGRYRIMLFVVTGETLGYSTDLTDGHLAWRPPSMTLPLDRVDVPYDAHDRWFMLAYEFEHPRGQPAKLVAEPADPAVHLEKSGVLAALRAEAGSAAGSSP